MTTETTWRDEFDVVLKTIVLPGEFDILDATDRSRWLGALQQSYDAGRNKAEQYKEDAERCAFAKTLAGQVVTMETFKKLGASALDDELDKAMAEDAAIDKARKS